MALLLFRPDLDAWTPGEHTGTFRGNNLAFVAATALLERYWCDDYFAQEVRRKGEIMQKSLESLKKDFPKLDVQIRGRGMVWGIEVKGNIEFAEAMSKACFDRYLITETCGVRGQVLKLLPSLTIDEEYLKEGLKRIKDSFHQVAKEQS